MVSPCRYNLSQPWLWDRKGKADGSDDVGSDDVGSSAGSSSGEQPGEQQGGAEPEVQQGTVPPRGDEEQGPKRHCAASTSAAAAPLDMEPLAC